MVPRLALTEVTALDATARKALYAGSVLVVRRLPSLIDLCARAQESVVAAYGSRTRDEGSGSAQEKSTAVITDLCSQYEGDSQNCDLLKSALAEAGVRLDATRWDRVRLRIQSPSGVVDDVANTPMHGVGRFSQTLPIHRDTWANNLMCQINAWAPLAPLDERRTLQLFPKFFKEPVSNDSASWSFDELLTRRKAGERYPQMPVLTAGASAVEVDAAERGRIEADAQAIVVDPGDLVLFSGAHLHGSVINFSGLPRFSTEVRLYDVADAAAGLGAPNVDGRTKTSERTSKWFKDIK
eukprot:TRINITY_DN26626_c0_g1_i1.p1 TRINITY_DN26626_c0_g1~~TRINITY_DN26626_c0_g1_i1.p1  ORF type:complete len:313 (-),score=51.62 TRINITY_DN26626_c0_g1_i1:16-903(-)